MIYIAWIKLIDWCLSIIYIFILQREGNKCLLFLSTFIYLWWANTIRKMHTSICQSTWTKSHIKNKVAAFRGMHVSPAKHNYARLPRKCDYRTDTQTPDKVIPMCRYASQATQKVSNSAKLSHSNNSNSTETPCSCCGWVDKLIGLLLDCRKFLLETYYAVCDPTNTGSWGLTWHLCQG